jgi:Domain of unknown function (DUF4124)
MYRHIAFVAVLLTLFQSANADIWTWTDAKGEVHMVTSAKPIYTWLDESGDVHYSDTPDHENAVSVDLVWRSTGSVAPGEEEKRAPTGVASDSTYQGETGADRLAREQAEADYCKRAKDIYESYLSAPRLYETDSNGKRIYLDKKQTAAKLSETESVVAQLCN